MLMVMMFLLVSFKTSNPVLTKFEGCYLNAYANPIPQITSKLKVQLYLDVYYNDVLTSKFQDCYLD